MKKYEQSGFAVTSRTYQEYVRMFALREEQLAKGQVLDVSGGASSFAAEAAVRGYDVTAVDPMYASQAEELDDLGHREAKQIIGKLEALKDQFDWSYYQSPQRHYEQRIASLQQFINDYRQQRKQRGRRYVAASLPHLPFDDEQFEFIVHSHLLFLYAEQLDETFHLEALRELLRILSPTGELRIYPILSLSFEPYPHLERILLQLRTAYPTLQWEQAVSELPFIPRSHYYLRLYKNQRLSKSH